jgi:tetratricopeptide (TPR) repeat protein
MEIDENFVMGYYVQASDCVAQGLYTEAHALAEKAYSIDPRGTQTWLGLVAGIRSRVGAPHEELLRRLESQWLGLAAYHLVRDEMELALDCVEKAIAQRDPTLTLFVSSLFRKNLRQNPRWPTLARMMNLPGEDTPTKQ